jgi:FG-GAP repeat
MVLSATDGASILASLDNAGNQLWGQHSANIEGVPEASDRFGTAVASGDFDGDGRDDLAIGSPGESVNGWGSVGAVNVIYGANAGLAAVDDQIWTQESPNVEGVPEQNDRFGFALAVGDFDGNGFDDLAIGVPGDSVAQPGQPTDAWVAGVVNVLYGGPSGLSAAFDQIWTQDSGLSGVSENYDRFGFALAAGDFDGDGFDDLAIGAPGENIEFVEHNCGPGGVNVVYGSAARLTSAGNQVWTQGSLNVEGTPENYKCFGRALAAGDFDNDGFEDLAIGVPAPTVFTSTSAFFSAGPGAVNVLYGTNGGLSAAGDQIWMQGVAGVQGAGGENNQFGWALAAGDLNGDGADDLAIGAPAGRGEVNVLYGTVNGLTGSVDQRWDQDSTGVLGDASTTIRVARCGKTTAPVFS